MLSACIAPPLLLAIFLSFVASSGYSSNLNERNVKLTKRQSGIGCLLGMVPPLGSTIQYSTGGNSQFGSSLGALYPERTSATLICRQGFPIGQSTSVCLNGLWQPAVFSGCSTAGNAGVLGSGGNCLLGMAPVLNGNLVYSNGLGLGIINQQTAPYPQGTIVRLQCLNGQLPSGQSQATCLSGQWQPALLGTCPAGGIGTFFSGGGIGGIGGQQQQCAIGVSNIPLNGRIVYSNNAGFGPFPVNTVATLVCNAGFMPSGTSSSICQNGGFTPSLLGSCVPAFK